MGRSIARLAAHDFRERPAVKESTGVPDDRARDVGLMK